MFKSLDALLHSELRLGIMSLLMQELEAEFGYLKDQTSASSGNLSVQLQKLTDAGYITQKKSFKGKYPLTTCFITPVGRKAFEDYVDALKSYVQVLNDSSKSKPV